jgi:hypothetical protein
MASSPGRKTASPKHPYERFVRSQSRSFQSLGVVLPLGSMTLVSRSQLHLLSRDETLILQIWGVIPVSATISSTRGDQDPD